MIRTDSGYFRNINGFLVALGTIIVLVGLWQIRGILMLGLAAVMLTVLASMPVRPLMRLGLNRSLAILGSMISGVLIIVLLGFLVFPTLIGQFAVLFTELIPSGINQLIELWNSGEIFEQVPILEEMVNNADITIDSDLINQAITQASQALSRVSGSVIPLIGGVASAVLSTTIIVFLCMYLIAEPDRYLNGIIALTPLWYRERMREILERIDQTIRSWLKVTGASMILISLGTAVGLMLLGIEQWAALGVLTGALSFIPNFGTIAALIPAIAVAIVQAPGSIFLVIFIILGMSFLQAQVIGPILTNESMNLPPVLILMGQIVFGVFFGFLGIMLAVPLTAIVTLLVEEIYIQDILGDSGKVAEGHADEDDEMVFAEAD